MFVMHVFYISRLYLFGEMSLSDMEKRHRDKILFGETSLSDMEKRYRDKIIITAVVS